MKKIITIFIASVLCVGIYAQDVKTKNKDVQKKPSTTSKLKDETRIATLDGRSFKISFTEKKGAPKAAESTPSDKPAIDEQKDANAVGKTEVQAGKPDYSMFDANSKVILSFVKGNLQSPIFESTCPYHHNTSGNEMHAFSAHCKLSSGNVSNKPGAGTAANTAAPMNDTKMAMDAENKTISDPDHTDVSTMPNSTPDKNDNVPAGDEKNPVVPSSSENAAPPASSSASGDWQTQSAPVLQTGYMATISGVVSGNSIEGTLSWKDASGTAISYSFTGSAATKKDLSENPEVGMK